MTSCENQQICSLSSWVSFLLAKRFSDFDNPDCLDFPASRNKNLKQDCSIQQLPSALIFFSFQTYKMAINRPMDHRRDVTHILCKVISFLLKSFHFCRLRKRQVFFLHKSLYFKCYATLSMSADAHFSSLGYPCFHTSFFISFRQIKRRLMEKWQEKVVL